MKILHLGLMINQPINGFQRALINAFDEYVEVPTNTFNFNEVALFTAKQLKPDIIFIQIQQGGVLNEETAKELSNYGLYVKPIFNRKRDKVLFGDG